MVTAMFDDGPDEPEESPASSPSSVVEIFGADDEFDDHTVANAAPLYWPSLGGNEAGTEWTLLYEWVTLLQDRFRGMVRLPACWYRHNDLVEALSALRDHERASYADTAKPISAVAWHTAFRDIEARLRVWIAELRCGGDPDYHDPSVHAPTTPVVNTPAEFEAWIARDKEVRGEAAARAAAASVVPQHLDDQEGDS